MKRGKKSLPIVRYARFLQVGAKRRLIGGELAARVFAMFEERLSFAKIVIATQQDPEVILGLWARYRAGFDDQHAREEDEKRRQEEHDEQMREIDRELKRKRRTG